MITSSADCILSNCTVDFITIVQRLPAERLSSKDICMLTSLYIFEIVNTFWHILCLAQRLRKWITCWAEIDVNLDGLFSCRWQLQNRRSHPCSNIIKLLAACVWSVRDMSNPFLNTVIKYYWQFTGLRLKRFARFAEKLTASVAIRDNSLEIH